VKNSAFDVVGCGSITSSFAVAERPRDALCLSVVGFNKIIIKTHAESFIIVL